MAMRSSDKGKTWSDPYIAFNIDFNQHGFVAIIPEGSKRIYSFGTQPVWGLYLMEDGRSENTPIGYFYSDDDGYTWTGPKIIAPSNDPGYLGMSVMPSCVTSKGTWLISTYDNFNKQMLNTAEVFVHQYMLRSEDCGKSWTLLPDKRPNGWTEPAHNWMGEGRVIEVCGRVFMLCRTVMGSLYSMYSDDDGKTWSNPKPSGLVHPDAPPMLNLLSDKKTLLCLHHNRHSKKEFTGQGVAEPLQMGDRSEIWASVSKDRGETWSEPVFLFCNAVRPDNEYPFFNHQCSYIDMFSDNGMINLFVPHRWQQVLHLQIREEELKKS